MCETDGGIRVYERIKLPADRFDERGDITSFDLAIKKTHWDLSTSTDGISIIFTEERRLKTPVRFP